ncbi:MAG: hypothetical protein ACXW2F_13380, partial [Thermoanaerobaculia bacterium]
MRYSSRARRHRRFPRIATACRSYLATYERTTRVDPDKRLVDLQSLIPGIVLDIRYATTNNLEPRDHRNR